MASEVGAGEVDVEALRREIQARIEEKKAQGLYTEEELRELAGHRLEPVLAAHDLKSTLLPELFASAERWNYSFRPDTLYRSSRGLVGQALETVRRLLRPVQKLFWNPNPMVAALSRQSDLNSVYVHLLHNLTLELTRLNLEVHDLKSRVLQLQAGLDLLARREKALEDQVAEGRAEKGSVGT
jgi:hypothetical protein